MSGLRSSACEPGRSTRRFSGRYALTWLFGQLLAVGLLAGCAHQPGSPPVVDRSTGVDGTGSVGTVGAESAQLPRAAPLHGGVPPDGHVVQAGDTLYGIAWRYGVDYRAVARLNGIPAPYRIQVGQRLLLADPGGAAMSGPLAAGASLPAGEPMPAGGTAPEMAPAEPSSRGFEFIPETPAVGARQETWQDLPPPSATAAGVPTAPGTTTTPMPGSQAPPPYSPPPSAPLGGGPAPALPAPQAGVGMPVPDPQGADAARSAALPAPGASAPLPTPSAPLDEIPPETLGSVPQAPAPVAPAPAAVPAPAASASRAEGGVGTWRWPTSGKVEKGFGNGNKGIDFRLDPAKPVVAAGGGEVVYAGNGLGGFRHLVIVKHDQRFLSAYSLNWPIAVKEGQRIDAGGTIAAAGGGSASTLRFEIRRDGQPVDPAGIIKR